MRSTTTSQSKAAAVARPAAASRRASAVVIEDAPERHCEGGGIPRWYEHGVEAVGRHLPIALDVGGDDGHPRGHRLDDGVAETLLTGGGGDGHVGAREQRRHLGMVEPAEHRDP